MDLDELRDREFGQWEAHWSVRKYRAGLATPYAVIHLPGNVLSYGGVSCLWQCLVGNGTGTSTQTLTYFNNGNAFLGVGDSTTAAAATQTDLQAASNKQRVAMDATFPVHTDGTTSTAATITFQSTFTIADGNFAWAEMGCFNRATAAGRMLNRRVAALGTKTGADVWVLQLTVTIS